MPLNHPDDLQSFDNMLYKNAVEWVLENPVNDICLPFSHSEASPWNNSLVEIPLGDEKFQASMLTDANKVSLNVSAIMHLFVH